MLKTTKKLMLNKEQLRVLADANLERVAGGYLNTTGTQWCSSTAYGKCGGCGYDPDTSPRSTASARCVNP